ncbi:YggU family protein [Candidatus Bathyarchaeota archaeon]|nr:YggU family protein [Candidatus Bathyarchaeota archaeon]
MKLLKTDQGVVLNVYVKPDSREFRIEVENEELVVHCRESPVKGKVNKELVKALSKLFKRRIEIVAGFTSKQKKILIPNISVEESNKILSA